jgi:uncharacterized membrane protein
VTAFKLLVLSFIAANVFESLSPQHYRFRLEQFWIRVAVRARLRRVQE